MAVRTFLPNTKIVGKPLKQVCPLHPQTLGEHIKKARIDKGLLQKEVAGIIQVTEDTITYWENGRLVPQVRYYPAIISFPGYYPFDHETVSVGGKLRQLLYCNGWNHIQCAKALGIDGGTVKRILKGKRTFKEKSKNIVLLWSQLPNYLNNRIDTLPIDSGIFILGKIPNFKMIFF